MTLSLTLGATLGAQARPNFSGTWIAEPESDKPPGTMGSHWGSPLTITQDDQQLVVEQTLFSRYDLQPPVRTVYAFDGSETRNTVMTGHATQVRTSRMKWDGEYLAITTSYPVIDPQTRKAFQMQVAYRWWIEPSTGVLVIEATRDEVFGGRAVGTHTRYTRKPN